MLTFLHSIFIILAILVIITDFNLKYKNVLFVIIILFLVFFAGLRSDSSDRDYQHYLQMFDEAPNINAEPFFVLISGIIKNTIGNVPIVLFLVFSSLSLIIKFFAIKKLTDYWFISIFIYFSYYYILHDLTQIRVGVASAFLLLLVFPIYDRCFTKFLIICLLASCFHYSAIVFLFLWFLKKGLNKKTLFLMIPLGYVLYFINFNPVISIPIGNISDKLNVYNALMEEYSERQNINVFNLFFLLKILIYYFLLFKYNSWKHLSKYSSLILSIFGISIFSFLFFAKFPIVAFRVNELLGVIEIVLFTFIYDLFKPKLIGITLLLTIGAVYFYTLIYNIKIIS